MIKPKKGGLGKGLDALFVDNETADSGIVTLRISEIEPNKNQPRKHFDEQTLSELADSIKEHGVIQPLLVRPLDGGGYQIIAGERRWRASRMAGLNEVPVVINDTLNEEQVVEIALIENLQRENLNPIEEAQGYSMLLESYAMTQEQIAKKVGKSRPVIANALRLLHLPAQVLEMVESGSVSSGHARALLGLEDKEEILKAARLIQQGKLSVRDVEKMMQKSKNTQKKVQTASPEENYWGDGFLKEMELALESELGRKVKISGDAKKSIGTIEIPFYNKQELADLAKRLAGLR